MISEICYGIGAVGFIGAIAFSPHVIKVATTVTKRLCFGSLVACVGFVGIGLVNTYGGQVIVFGIATTQTKLKCISTARFAELTHRLEVEKQAPANMARMSAMAAMTANNILPCDDFTTRFAELQDYYSDNLAYNMALSGMIADKDK
jgi:hypothetical protein